MAMTPDAVEALRKIAAMRPAFEGGSIAECRRIAENALTNLRNTEGNRQC